jgi:hypothetical protein
LKQGKRHWTSVNAIPHDITKAWALTLMKIPCNVEFSSSKKSMLMHQTY